MKIAIKHILALCVLSISAKQLLIAQEQPKNLNTGTLKSIADTNPEQVLFLKDQERFLTDIKARDQMGNASLAHAAMYGDIDAMKLLLDKGAKVDDANPFGATALIYIASSGKIDAIKLLLDKGADVNVLGGMALRLAVAANRKDIAELLLQHGALINAQDEHGYTALMYAVQYGNVEIVKLLLDNRADAKIRDKDGKTAYYFAANNKAVKALLVAAQSR